MRRRNNGGDFIKGGVPVSFICKERSSLRCQRTFSSLSMGQVKVKVKVAGVVRSGDYILADGSHVGYAKAKSEVTFEEFRDKVVGMAWESKGEGTGKVLVAVGVK